mmetsp:Transcript_34523/g.41653  ORF Transcript_34523/g.41653 Transcript_34523/m.41653 type:complete len:101 (-) Transcript_34523:13-315(-)
MKSEHHDWERRRWIRSAYRHAKFPNKQDNESPSFVSFPVKHSFVAFRQNTIVLFWLNRKKPPGVSPKEPIQTLPTQIHGKHKNCRLNTKLFGTLKSRRLP